MVDIVEAVQKGMSGKYLFHDPSFSEPIFYRAITRYEHEMAKFDAMEYCSKPVMEYLADQASFNIDPISEKELTEDQIREYMMYMFDMLVNIVYYGTRDFQPVDYEKQTIKDSFMDVRNLALEILQVSVRKKEEVIALINTSEGKNLLGIHYHLNVPLTDEAWKLTPLQVDFLVHGKIKETKPASTAATISQEDLDKDPEKVKEYLKALFHV